MGAPFPPDEVERLAALRRYNILDTAPERALDDLTRLASIVCGTPMALVTVIDERRQWFKSKVRLDRDETLREHAFCSYAILDDVLMEVPDATVDERFRDNPYVLGEPHIRFYAGAPLTVASGHRIGTLCVLDHVPRQLDDTQKVALETLRDAVVTQLELGRALDDIANVSKVLSMCAWCRAVQDSEGNWMSLDAYVSKTTQVSHGMCPRCEGLIDK